MQIQTATILSAEIMGFQSLAENLSPKEITPLMSELHELIVNAIRLHQGKFHRFTGDTFLAVFYLSKSGSRASINAADAVFEIKERLDLFTKGKKLPAPLELKVGIATGNIISGNIGSGDKKQETVMGEAVNHANRICRFAGKGQIVVDENSHEVVKKSFEFQILEPIPLKGTDKTLGIFELSAKKRIKLKPEEFSERKITSEMVGRNREMELIEAQVKKLMAGEGSVVNIVGKAGIGKSRLMDEIKIQPLMKKAALLEGRAQSIGKNLSFHPLTHIIKSWAGITEEDPPSVSPGKLQKSIARVANEQADEIFPFLATMMGMPLKGKHKERVAGIEGEALEKLILKNLRDLITAAAAIRPLVIIIEDLHWADASSVTFLESLFKLVQKNRILFINVFRPGHKETGDFILRFLNENLQEDHITIKLDPLIETESRELITNLLHNSSLPAGVYEMIIRKTGGNPFFIEEVIRSFIDNGIIEIKGNEFIITEKIHRANIPETINEVILSRVDKLDEKTRELLNTASVIGRNFYYKVLEEAADTIGELDERIEYLKDVQLIGESKKKEEIEFLFKHALAQQATYDSILKESRKELHLKIAHSIEKVFAENLHEFYGTLATHYEAAEDIEKTENYLFMAGKESLHSGAPSEALSFFTKGLELYQTFTKGKGEDQKLADYYFNLGISCYSGGYNIETINYVDKFERLHKTGLPHNKILLILGTVQKLIKLLLAVNFKHLFFKKPPTPLDDIFIRLFAAKAESMVTIDPGRFFFEIIYFASKLVNWDLRKSQVGDGVFTEISANFFWTGISVSLGRKILEVYDKSITKDKKSAWMKTRYPKLVLRLFSGDFTADKDEDDVFETGLKAGAFWETTAYLIFSTYIHIENGNLGQAKKITDRVLEVADSFENVHSKAQYYRLSSVMLIKFRKLEQVLSLSEKGIEFTGKTGHMAVNLVIQSCRVIALCLTNKLSEAAEILSKARIIAIERKRGVIFYSTYLVAKCHYEIAFAKLTSVDNKIESDKKKKLIKLSQELVKYSKKYSGNLGEAYRLTCIIHIITGNYKKALSFFKTSIEFGETSGGNLELSRTFFELGKFLSDPNVKYNELNGQPAGYYLEKAKTMFEEMDLQWDLEEYRNFMQS